MLDNSLKNQKIPRPIQEAIFSPAAKEFFDDPLYKKAGFNAFDLVLSIAKGEIRLDQLVDLLQQRYNFTATEAQTLKIRLINKIFQPVLGYLPYGEPVIKASIQPAASQTPVVRPVAAAPVVAKKTLAQPPRPPLVPSPKFSAPVKTAESNQPVRTNTAFSIYPEDEEEIKKYLNVSAVKNRDYFQQVLSEEATRLIVAANLPKLDEAAGNRLHNIVSAYLRGIRDWVETRGFLMHQPQAGGVNLTKEQAENFLDFINKNRQSSEALHTAATAAAESAKKRDFPQKKTEETVANNFVSHNYIPAGLKKSSELSSQKPLVEDIKYAKKLVGPLDELAGFSLLDFRRLNPDPKQAAQNVKAKVELLSAEGTAKRIAAIRAWKSSPVHQLYLGLGLNSLQKKQSLQDSLKELAADNSSNLTLNEFLALQDLSRTFKI